MLQVVAIAVVSVFAWLNYTWFITLANRLARTFVERVEPTNVPLVEAIGIALLPAWFVVTMAAYLLLAIPFDLPLTTLFARSSGRSVSLGVALGIGEAAVTMTLAAVLNQALAARRRSQPGGNPSLEYRILGQSGWMRTYQYPFKWLPTPVAVCIVAFPLLGEELVFRAAAMNILDGIGLGPAVMISTALFMAVQTRFLPSWYQSVGPMAGACVMGISHGLLFAWSGDLLLVLVGHLTFFMMIAIGRSVTAERSVPARASVR